MSHLLGSSINCFFDLLVVRPRKLAIKPAALDFSVPGIAANGKTVSLVDAYKDLED